MLYKVELTRVAEADLNGLYKSDRKVFEKIINKVQSLPEKPIEGKALTGNFKGSYSLRVNKYRIIYELNDVEGIIYILTVKRRKNVYG